MKPRRNRVKTNRAKNRNRTRNHTRNRRNRTRNTRKRYGGTCEDTNQRAFAYTTQFLYDK